MAYLKFVNESDLVECTVTPVGSNVVTLEFTKEVILNSSGFDLFLDPDGEIDIGGGTYRNYRTIYRNDEVTAAYNGYQLSNDGSVYIPPVPVIHFTAGYGGELTGEIEQEVERYEDLDIPVPKPNENYRFVKWVPEIPDSGKITEDHSYTAEFEYVPTLDEIKAEKKSEISGTATEKIHEGVLYDDFEFPYFDSDQEEIADKLEKAVKLKQPVVVYTSVSTSKVLSEEQMKELYTKQEENKSHHKAYTSEMYKYIDSLENAESVKVIVYGHALTGKYLEEYNSITAQEAVIVQKYIESLENSGGVSPDISALKKKVESIEGDLRNINTALLQEVR